MRPGSPIFHHRVPCCLHDMKAYGFSCQKEFVELLVYMRKSGKENALVLQNDNAGPHMAGTVMNYVTKFGWKTILLTIQI